MKMKISTPDFNILLLVLTLEDTGIIIDSDKFFSKEFKKNMKFLESIKRY